MSADPTIHFNNALAVWFYDIPPAGSYLGALLEEEGRLVFRWRIADPQGKRWYEAYPPAPLADSIRQVRGVVRTAAMLANMWDEPSELLRGTMPEEEWIRLLLAQPWVHITQAHKAGHA